MAEWEDTLHRKCIYCPECLAKGFKIPVKRHQLTDNYYLVLCTDKENCSFHESGSGEAQVNIEDLVDCGLPGQLLEFMDLYQEDLNKIVCLGFYEHFIQHFDMTKDSIKQWQKAENSFKLIASYHNLNLELPVRLVSGPHCIQTVKSALESCIADISPEYKATVKDAFSRITSYKFPDDLINSLKRKNEASQLPS